MGDACAHARACVVPAARSEVKADRDGLHGLHRGGGRGRGSASSTRAVGTRSGGPPGASPSPPSRRPRATRRAGGSELHVRAAGREVPAGPCGRLIYQAGRPGRLDGTNGVKIRPGFPTSVLLDPRPAAGPGCLLLTLGRSGRHAPRRGGRLGGGDQGLSPPPCSGAPCPSVLLFSPGRGPRHPTYHGRAGVVHTESVLVRGRAGKWRTRCRTMDAAPSTSSPVGFPSRHPRGVKQNTPAFRVKESV